MNDNNTPGENSNSEQPNVGATPTPPPSQPHSQAPDAAAQPAPAQQQQPQQPWQPPAGSVPPQPGQAAPTPSAHPGQFARPAQQPAPAPQSAPTYGSAPQPMSRPASQVPPQPGQRPTQTPGQPGAAFNGIPQPHTPQGAPQQPYGAPQPYPGPNATQPTLSLDPTVHHVAAGSESQKSKKSGSGTKIAGLFLAAALVGGVAGLGGSAIGANVFNRPVAESATGPQTVTVNNPGSVNETTAVATRVLPSVVTIEVAGRQESGSGSGVILDKDGHVLTNTHVVTLGGAAADPQIRVTTSDGHIYSATIVGTDPIYDLAVIKLDDAKNLTPVEFTDSSKLNVGDTAIAVGAPLGLSNSVTTGIVSALNRSIQVASSALPEGSGQQDGDDGNGSGGPFQFDIPGMGTQQQPKQSISIAVIQTDAAINPGNSGGALVDSKGRLIGINVAIATAGGSSSSEAGSIGVGFAIPSAIAQRVSDEIIADGAATHGLLGATVRDASTVRDATVAGAVIDTPTAGGAAADAGLKRGDVITEFNGAPITSATDLTAQVRAVAAGSDAKFTYVRDGKTYTAEVTLGTLKL